VTTYVSECQSCLKANCPSPSACHNPFCFIPTSLSSSLAAMQVVPFMGVPHPTYHLGCHGSHAWALAGPITTPCSCGIVGVIAVVSSLSAQHHSHCGCRCASGCRSHCSPAHRNIISILKIEREKIHKWPGGDIPWPCWLVPHVSAFTAIVTLVPTW